MNAKQKRIVLGIAGTCVLFVIISAAMKNSTPQTPGITPPGDAAQNQAAPSPSAPPVAAAPAEPVLPKHYYVMEEDGEYGYAPALSENDRKQGTQAKALLMFRYLGEKDGVVTVQLKDGPATQSASCKSPCEFIKIRTIYAGEVIKTETIQSTGQAIIDGVLSDARNGLLLTYKKKSG